MHVLRVLQVLVTLYTTRAVHAVLDQVVVSRDAKDPTRPCKGLCELRINQ